AAEATAGGGPVLRRQFEKIRGGCRAGLQLTQQGAPQTQPGTRQRGGGGASGHPSGLGLVGTFAAFALTALAFPVLVLLALAFAALAFAILAFTTFALGIFALGR